MVSKTSRKCRKGVNINGPKWIIHWIIQIHYRADSARAMTHYMQWIPKLNAPTSNSQKWPTRRNYKLQFRNYVKQDPANTLKSLKNTVSTRVRFIVASQAKPSLFMNFTPPH